MTLEQELREKAAELGFCAVGFTTMDDLDRVEECVTARDYEPGFADFIIRGTHPREIFPEGKSIIVLVRDFAHLDFPESLLPHIARAYLGRMYLPIEGSPARVALDEFEAFLTEKGIAFSPDRNVLNMRATGERAGVITFGRNNFAYADGVGSFIILYGYLVDIELDNEGQVASEKCPPTCHACIDACPTGAMESPYCLNLEKCVLWNNAIRVKRTGDKSIPSEIIDDLGVRIHGCDACQVACPRNAHALRQEKTPDPLLEHIAEGFSLDKVLHMPEGYYEEYLRPVMYNYITDLAVFQRNAAIAMGNSGDKAWIPHLEAELDNADESVRTYVRWALDKLS